MADKSLEKLTLQVMTEFASLLQATLDMSRRDELDPLHFPIEAVEGAGGRFLIKSFPNSYEFENAQARQKDHAILIRQVQAILKVRHKDRFLAMLEKVETIRSSGPFTLGIFVEMPAPPVKLWTVTQMRPERKNEITALDRRFLRSLRIGVDDDEAGE